MAFQILLALLWAVVFGVLFSDLSTVGDDLYHQGVLVGIPADRPLREQLYRVVFLAEGGGHFKPYQDALAVIGRAAFGPEGWAPFALAIHIALHLVCAQLLHGLLLRLGAEAFVARTAAILFLLHPAVDASLSQLLFAPNVLGFAGLLLALRLSCARGAEGPSGLRLTAVAFLTHVATSANVSVLVTAPLLVLPLLLWRVCEGRRRPFSEASAFLLGGLATVLHRWLSYGTLTTKMETYRATLEGQSPRGDFPHQVFEQLFLLQPSGSVRALAGRLGPEWPEAASFEAPTAAPLVVLLLMLAASFGAVFGGQVCGVIRKGGIIRPLGAGLVLMLGAALPYALFLDSMALNRYLYGVVLGLACVVASIIALVAPKRGPLAWICQGLLVAALLLLSLPETLRRSESIALAHRELPGITAKMAAEIEPEVEAFDAIAFPRALLPMAPFYLSSEHLQCAVSHAVGRPLRLAREGWLASWFQGRAESPADSRFALFLFDAPDAPRRIRHPLDPREALALRPRLADDLIGRRPPGEWAAGLAAETALEIGFVAEGLLRADAGGVALVRRAYGPLRQSRLFKAPNRPTPLEARQRSATALIGVLPGLLAQDPGLAQALIQGSFDELPEMPGLLPAIMDAIDPRAHPGFPDLLSRFSECDDPAGVRGLVLLQKVPGLGDFGAAGRAELVRRATEVKALREGLPRGESLEATFSACRDLHLAWKDRGIPRRDLWHMALRAALAIERAGGSHPAAETAKRELPAHEVRFALAAEPEALAAGAALAFLGSDLRSYLGAGQRGDLHLAILAGPEGLCGGESPWGCRVQIRMETPDANTIWRHSRWLPAPGLGGGEAASMSFVLRRPPHSGPVFVHIELLVSEATVFALPPVPLTLP